MAMATVAVMVLMIDSKKVQAPSVLHSLIFKAKVKITTCKTTPAPRASGRASGVKSGIWGTRKISAKTKVQGVRAFSSAANQKADPAVRPDPKMAAVTGNHGLLKRSEERRVGKEC